MANASYLEIAEFEGNCGDVEFETMSRVYDFRHEYEYNFDSQQGIKTGNLLIQPTVARIQFDQTWPELLKAMRKSTPLGIKVYHTDTDDSGAKVISHQDEYVTCILTSIAKVMPNTLDPNNAARVMEIELKWSCAEYTAKVNSFTAANGVSTSAVEDVLLANNPTA